MQRTFDVEVLQCMHLCERVGDGRNRLTAKPAVWKAKWKVKGQRSNLVVIQKWTNRVPMRRNKQSVHLACDTILNEKVCIEPPHRLAVAVYTTASYRVF